MVLCLDILLSVVALVKDEFCLLICLVDILQVCYTVLLSHTLVVTLKFVNILTYADDTIVENVSLFGR